MSLNPSNKTNEKEPKQKIVSSKTRWKIIEDDIDFVPSSQTVILNSEDQFSVIIEDEYGIQAKKLSDVLSYIAETISKDELKTLFFNLKQKQQMTLPTLEKKLKMYELPTRKEFLSKNPTTAIRQQLLQNEEDPYGNMNILGESLLEYNLAEIPYDIIYNKPWELLNRKKDFLTSEQRLEREELRQKQFQEQEDLYDRMSILGDSIREYNITESTDDTKKSQKQYKKKEVVTNEQKIEREQLRQLQLQEQEDLYDQMDLLGETLLKFSPLQPSTSSSQKSIEDDEFNSHATISIPSDDTPQTSSGPRRISKYLSPAQVAQLAKIRKKRYEQQEREYLQGELLGDAVPTALKDKYSFRQPNARLRSPRELVFRKSIINVKRNKDLHSKTLVLPVMNFPPSNWPTPIKPEVRQDLDKLRHEQLQNFFYTQIALSHAMQNAQQRNENEDQETTILQRENLRSTGIQQYNLSRNQNNQRRYLVGLHDGDIAFSIKDQHKKMKYLFLILFVQWLLIIGIDSLFKYHEPSSLWLKSSGDWTWVYILCTLNIVIFSFTILPNTRNNFPINLKMLTLFVLLVAFLFSFLEIYYPNDAVVMMLASNCEICLCLTLFFWQNKYYFTYIVGFILHATTLVIFTGVYKLLYDIIVLHISCAAAAFLIYAWYLVFNTSAILNNKSKFHLDSGNYILGVIHLNLDFIFIPVDKVRCL